MVDPTCATLYQWSTKQMKTLFIRCDGAGENHSLEDTLHSSQRKMPIAFEYTGRNTPQQSLLQRLVSMLHIVEVGLLCRELIPPRSIATVTFG
jgi:hypothetical protein